MPEDGPHEARYAQRIHGAWAFDGRRRGQLIAVGSDRGGPEGFDLDYVQAELFVELSEEQARLWATGLRFDARLGNGAQADQFAVNWLNEFRLADRLSARAAGIASVQSGDNAADGLHISGRASVTYDLGAGYALALESFNSFGSTGNLGLNGRSQQLGPVLSGRAGDGWRWSFGNLFGLNEATPDNDVRIWISRDF